MIKMETGSLYKTLFGESKHKIIRGVLVEEGIINNLASIAGLFKLGFEAKKIALTGKY